MEPSELQLPHQQNQTKHEWSPEELQEFGRALRRVTPTAGCWAGEGKTLGWTACWGLAESVWHLSVLNIAFTPRSMIMSTQLKHQLVFKKGNVYAASA